MELSHDFIEEFLESKGVREILKKTKLPLKWNFDCDYDDYENTQSLEMYSSDDSGVYFNVHFSGLPGCCGGTVIHSPKFDDQINPIQRKALFDLALKIVAISAWETQSAGSTVICTTISDQKHFIEVLEAHRFRRVGEHENANTSRIVTTWWKGVNKIEDRTFMEEYEDPKKDSDEDDEDDSAGLNEAIGKCNCPDCRASRTQVPGDKPKKANKLRL